MAKLMSVQEVADYLGVSTKTVRRLKDRGDIPYTRVGSQIRFAPRDIVNYLKQNSHW